MKATNFEYHKLQLKKEIGKCELCGSTRGLEIHHIIPSCCGKFLDIDLDTDDNLICLCSACHSKLTPNGKLISLGMKQRKQHNQIVIYQTVLKQIRESFYERLNETLTKYGELSSYDCITAFEYAMDPILEKRSNDETDI